MVFSSFTVGISSISANEKDDLKQDFSEQSIASLSFDINDVQKHEKVIRCV